MADYFYGLPREKPTPLPYALRIGFDWSEYHTPPVAGGLIDQPIGLLRDIRTAVNTYHALRAWREAEASLQGPAFDKWCALNSKTIEFVNYVWTLQRGEF